MLRLRFDWDLIEIWLRFEDHYFELEWTYQRNKDSGAKHMTVTPVKSAVNNTICIMYHRFRKNCSLPNIFALINISNANKTMQINSTVNVTDCGKTGKPKYNMVESMEGSSTTASCQIGFSKKDNDKKTMMFNVRNHRMLCNQRCKDNLFCVSFWRDPDTTTSTAQGAKRLYRPFNASRT